MNASRQLGVALLAVLATWFVIYWWQCAPVADTTFSTDGLVLNPDDTIGTNPAQSPDVHESAGGQTDPLQPGPPAQQDTTGGTGAGTDNGRTGSGSGRDAGSQVDPPEPAPVDPGELVIPPPPPTTPYTVQSGDTMESIALSWFGSAAKWVLIAQENPLVDPMRLRSGQSLRLPAKDAAVERIPPELLAELLKETRYVVAPNDTLSGIARHFYGNPNLWRIIYDANRDVVPNQDSLKLGVELVIPRYQNPAE